MTSEAGRERTRGGFCQSIKDQAAFISNEEEKAISVFGEGLIRGGVPCGEREYLLRPSSE